MSESRQEDPSVLARSYGLTFSRATLVPPASKTWHQLIYAIRGVVTVTAETGTWVVPPYRAVWLPADVRCRLGFSGKTALRMIYLRRSSFVPKPGHFDPSACSVVSVTPLLRELILRTVQLGALQATNPQHRRLSRLIQDELHALPTVPLQLPYPRSLPARNLIQLLRTDPTHPFDLKAALGEVGCSRRTIERTFAKETGLSLGQWIRRRKLLAGLEAVLGGETIASAAIKLGYNGPSAFIAMFKRELGSTPRAYLEMK